MKKILMTLTIVTMLLLTITGCHTTTSKTFAFKVETGDEVDIQLDTTEGYDLTSDLPFSILKDDKTLSQGTFITLDGYDQYISAVNNESGANIIESTTKDGLEYTFYSYNNSEWNYIIKIVDSNTGLLIGNPISETSAKECFDRLTISKK